MSVCFFLFKKLLISVFSFQFSYNSKHLTLAAFHLHQKWNPIRLKSIPPHWKIKRFVKMPYTAIVWYPVTIDFRCFFLLHFESKNWKEKKRKERNEASMLLQCNSFLPCATILVLHAKCWRYKGNRNEKEKKRRPKQRKKRRSGAWFSMTQRIMASLIIIMNIYECVCVFMRYKC